MAIIFPAPSGVLELAKEAFDLVYIPSFEEQSVMVLVPVITLFTSSVTN